MKLKLEKPLVVLDIESTGINPRLDRIIDLALIKLTPDGKQESYNFRFNPEMLIPAAAMAIHHITDEDVKDSPLFRELAARVLELLEDCDLAGFGVIRFDIPMLIEEFARAGLTFDDSKRRIFDAQRVFHKKEPRDLSAALVFYCGQQHLGAHGAMADTEATLKVMQAQLQKYPDLPDDMAGMNEFCNPPRDPNWLDKTGKLKWENGEVLINFGVQNLGKKLKDLASNNPKFLRWILKSDFPVDTKQIVSAALAGKFPAKP